MISMLPFDLAVEQGEIFAKLLLLPFSDAPRTGSAAPPRPSLNGIR